MKKYVFMYNAGDDLEKQIFKNRLNEAGIDYYFENFSFTPIDPYAENVEYEKVDNEGDSLWVLEEHYLVALTLLSYKLLLNIDEDGYEYDVQYVVDWYEKHKNNDIFVSYKGVELV